MLIVKLNFPCLTQIPLSNRFAIFASLLDESSAELVHDYAPVTNPNRFKSARTPKNAFSGKRTKRRLPRAIVRERESALPKLFTVSLQISHEYETATIDTGCTHSLLHVDLVENALTDMIPITSLTSCYWG